MIGLAIGQANRDIALAGIGPRGMSKTCLGRGILNRTDEAFTVPRQRFHPVTNRVIFQSARLERRQRGLVQSLLKIIDEGE